MADYISTIAGKQAQALVKGPVAGSSGAESARPVYSYYDSVTPTATVGTTDRLRFGVLPAGAQVLNTATVLSSSLVTFSGTVKFTPLDGSTAIEVTPVSVVQDVMTSVRSFPLSMELPVLTKPCWVDFVPGANAALTGIPVRARIEYSLNH